MNTLVILILATVAWALGPTVLQWVGGFFALLTVALLAFDSGGFHPDAAAVVGGGGALMWFAGTRSRFARETGYPTAVGARARRILGKLLLHGNPYGRVRRQFAVRVLSRLDYHEIDAVFRDAEEADGRTVTRPPSLWATLSERLRLRREDRVVREGAKADTASSRYGDRASAQTSPDDWINGTGREADDRFHDGHSERASETQALRDEVDRTLEEARDYLEPVICQLFALSGPDWCERLNAARSKRRRDLPPIEPSEGRFHDRRLLFATIAYDWGLIGHNFLRDPSPAARTLGAIANRYAHEGPWDDDPGAARQAFGEIVAALRPQAIERVKGFLKHYAPLSASRR